MLTASPVIELRLYFVDDDGASSRHSLCLLLAHLGQASAFVTVYASLVALVSNAALVRINIITTYQDQSSQRGAPGCDLHRTGVFCFDTDSTPVGIYVVSIPAITDAIVMQSGPFAGIGIDLTNPLVINLAAASTASGTIHLVDHTDAGLIALRTAYVGEVP